MGHVTYRCAHRVCHLTLNRNNDLKSRHVACFLSLNAQVRRPLRVCFGDGGSARCDIARHICGVGVVGGGGGGDRGSLLVRNAQASLSVASLANPL